MINITNEIIKIIQSTIYGNLKQIQKCYYNYIIIKSNTNKIMSLNKNIYINLHSLKNKELNNCKKCSLFKTRKNIVFGSGNKKAKLMFIGEAPGFFEDEKSSPLIGPAGKLLTKMITTMGYKRKDIYICNAIKCRPPKNRKTKNNEIKQCAPFLKQQIQIIKPKVIITLGLYAYKSIFNTCLSLKKIRGNFIYYKNINIMPTYHPAYLLRNPKKKKIVWKDLQKVIKKMT